MLWIWGKRELREGTVGEAILVAGIEVDMDMRQDIEPEHPHNKPS
jgi:hypothetical protein